MSRRRSSEPTVDCVIPFHESGSGEGDLDREHRAASTMRGARSMVPPWARTIEAAIERPRPAPPRDRERELSVR